MLWYPIVCFYNYMLISSLPPFAMDWFEDIGESFDEPVNQHAEALITTCALNETDWVRTDAVMSLQEADDAMDGSDWRALADMAKGLKLVPGEALTRAQWKPGPGLTDLVACADHILDGWVNATRANLATSDGPVASRAELLHWAGTFFMLFNKTGCIETVYAEAAKLWSSECSSLLMPIERFRHILRRLSPDLDPDNRPDVNHPYAGWQSYMDSVFKTSASLMPSAARLTVRSWL